MGRGYDLEGFASLWTMYLRSKTEPVLSEAEHYTMRLSPPTFRWGAALN